MKRFVLLALLTALVVSAASPVLAWDANKQKNLGQDSNKMQWYLLDYGKDSAGIPYAVSRKYYTNTTVKNETIELLMSKFNISPEVAGSLYFTEYGYEFTPDGKQFAVTYLRHYDMLGNEIHGTVYGDDDNPKTFAAVAGFVVPKAANYALGKPVSEPKKTTAAKKTTSNKKSTASKVVRKK